MDKTLHKRINIDTYIRKELGMCVRSDIYNVLDDKIKSILIDAKARAEIDKTKSIMARHI